MITEDIKIELLINNNIEIDTADEQKIESMILDKLEQHNYKIDTERIIQRATELYKDINIFEVEDSIAEQIIKEINKEIEYKKECDKYE